MSRLRAETMPAVTVPPRLNGLPMAMTQPQLFRIAELDRLERLVGLDPEQREIGLLILAEQLGLQSRAVIENDRDLVGLRDHMVVGHHDAGRVDDETGTERIDPARPAFAVLRVVLAAPIEEVLEQLVQLRIVGQLRHRRVARFDLLRGGDVDDRVDHPFGHVGDAVGTARER
jgi:hypothetical protein